ncbi:MAG: tetratricopeptide repeat protein [Lentisphaerae bacterium]|nr:tetratricopeptide repeat protein [Lentisphaerota bacterium]
MKHCKRHINRGRGTGRLACAALASLLAARAGFAADVPAGWQVREAPVRFRVSLRDRPTHASAGYVLQLPDGGLLPGPYPRPSVRAADGVALRSAVLWQNPETGFSLVFAAPESGGAVTIYVEPVQRPETWDPASGLTPSPLLCADPEGDDLGDARRLGRLGRVGDTVHYQPRAGIPKAPLCIQGDLSGRPPPTAFYLLAYLVTDDPGRTWVAPFTLKGVSEVRIDGDTIRPRKRIDKWGGTGDWADLGRGLHRLEVFAAFAREEDYSEGRGVMWLTWAPPNASLEELGGVRSKELPYAGTSMWASRVVAKDEIVRSGSCRVEAVEMRDGAPAAAGQAEATHVFWFEGETPILCYRLRAWTAGNPADTTYTWSFGENAAATGPAVRWLFPGRQEARVILAAASETGRSRCTLPFYTYGTVQTSFADPDARAAFRDACLAMLKAHPENADPTADWNAAMWSNLFRALEPGESDALLAYLFTERWEAVKRGLTAKRRARLEDRFLLMAERIDPESAVAWAVRFEEDARGARAAGLALRRAEMLLYDLGRPDAALELIRPVARRTDDVGRLASIRLGDAAFARGDVGEATRLYGAVQNVGRTDEDWRADAVLDGALSETVRSLLEQGYYAEALDELARWERRFPLSKVSSDFIVLEARLYKALGHYRRARGLLQGYVDGMDATSYLPQAAELLVQCLVAMRAPADEIRAAAEPLRQRLQYHPAAERIEALLRSL